MRKKEQLIKYQQNDEQLNISRIINCTGKNWNKKCSRREKERSRTQDFILVHPSSRATPSPLPTSKDFH